MPINALITEGAFIQDIMGMLKSIIPDINIHVSNTPIRKYYDLVVFSGGEDISPEIYGEENIASYPNPMRDKEEIAIIDKFFGKSKLYGICRGHQLLSAYVYGLKLVQHINPSHGSIHELDESFIGIKYVNSLHHQGVSLYNIIPYGVMAHYNNIIEAFHHVIDKTHGVQFHPELIYDKNYMKPYMEFLKKFILE